MTATEVKFIEAEARALTNDAGTEDAYNQTIDLSFEQLGIPGATTYRAQTSVAFSTARSSAVEKIINQKYLALYLQAEVYTDWRRTGFPTLTSNSTSRLSREVSVSTNGVVV